MSKWSVRRSDVRSIAWVDVAGSANPSFEGDSEDFESECDDGGKSMVTVDNGKQTLILDADEWDVIRRLPSDEGRTCPKPIISVPNVCGWCVLTKASPAHDPERALYRLWVEKRKITRKAAPLPAELRPFLEGLVGKLLLPRHIAERPCRVSGNLQSIEVE